MLRNVQCNAVDLSLLEHGKIHHHAKAVKHYGASTVVLCSGSYFASILLLVKYFVIDRNNLEMQLKEKFAPTKEKQINKSLRKCFEIFMINVVFPRLNTDISIKIGRLSVFILIF